MKLPPLNLLLGCVCYMTEEIITETRGKESDKMKKVLRVIGGMILFLSLLFVVQLMNGYAVDFNAIDRQWGRIKENSRGYEKVSRMCNGRAAIYLLNNGRGMKVIVYKGRIYTSQCQETSLHWVDIANHAVFVRCIAPNKYKCR